MTRYAYLRNDYPIHMSKQMESVIAVKYDKVYVESSDSSDRSQLDNILVELKRDDVLIVPDIRVLSLTLEEISNFFDLLMKKNVRFISLADELDSDVPLMFFDCIELFTIMIAEQKRIKNQMSVNQHRNRERELGRPRINDKKVKEIQFLYHNRGLTMRQIADKTDVALGTVYKYTSMQQKHSEK